MHPVQELNKNKAERKRARDEKLGDEDLDELKGKVCLLVDKATSIVERRVVGGAAGAYV